MAVAELPKQDLSEILTILIIGIILLSGIPIATHFSSPFFIIDPAQECVFYDNLKIRFSELQVPSIITTTSIEVAGEYGGDRMEVTGQALKSGRFTFLHAGWHSKRTLGRLASHLNEAIREYDEREAVRRWLERREQRTPDE